MARVYIHELVDISGHNRARYLHHVTANWSPVGRAERRQLCAGVWGVVGSTGRWPQVVNLWEYASWDDLAHNFEVELSSPTLQDPALAEWWAAAETMRSGGLDRILVAADFSPGIDELCARGVRGVAYAHELVSCRPGAAAALLDAVRSAGVDAHARAGLTLVGAYARAMADDDECLLIWAVPDWPTWGAYEGSFADADAPVPQWRRAVAPMVTGWNRTWMVDAELSPLRTGRQPEVSDRRPLDDL